MGAAIALKSHLLRRCGASRRAIAASLRRRAALPAADRPPFALAPGPFWAAAFASGGPSGPPSASSSRRVIVPAGGAPAPPGSGRSVRLPPAGAASLIPAIKTPHEAPSADRTIELYSVIGIKSSRRGVPNSVGRTNAGRRDKQAGQMKSLFSSTGRLMAASRLQRAPAGACADQARCRGRCDAVSCGRTLCSRPRPGEKMPEPLLYSIHKARHDHIDAPPTHPCFHPIHLSQSRSTFPIVFP